jgi:hypothetical protein
MGCLDIGKFLPVAEDLLRGLLLFNQVDLLLLASKRVQKSTRLAGADFALLLLTADIRRLRLLTGLGSRLRLLWLAGIFEFALFFIARSGRWSRAGLVFLVGRIWLFVLIRLIRRIFFLRVLLLLFVFLI